VDNIKMDLNKMIGRSWMGLIWLRTGTKAYCYEHSDELLGSI